MAGFLGCKATQSIICKDTVKISVLAVAPRE